MPHRLARCTKPMVWDTWEGVMRAQWFFCDVNRMRGSMCGPTGVFWEPRPAGFLSRFWKKMFVE
jgi:hypothetical protein